MSLSTETELINQLRSTKYTHYLNLINALSSLGITIGFVKGESIGMLIDYLLHENNRSVTSFLFNFLNPGSRVAVLTNITTLQTYHQLSIRLIRFNESEGICRVHYIGILDDINYSFSHKCITINSDGTCNTNHFSTHSEALTSVADDLSILSNKNRDVKKLSGLLKVLVMLIGNEHTKQLPDWKRQPIHSARMSDVIEWRAINDKAIFQMKEARAILGNTKFVESAVTIGNISQNTITF